MEASGSSGAEALVVLQAEHKIKGENAHVKAKQILARLLFLYGCSSSFHTDLQKKSLTQLH